MSRASDIANLFGVVDTSPSQYQEVERAEQMHGLRGRWSTLNAAEPDPVAPAPAALAQGDAIDSDDVCDATDTPETAESLLDASEPQLAQLPVACSIPAAASEPPAVEHAAPEQPVVQSKPEPVVAAQQSAALSSVFSRLMQRNEPRGDIAQRGAP